MQRATTVTGYLSGVQNPNFSGLATITVRTNRNPKRGKYVVFYTEAGFGVRQLVSIFGRNGSFVKESGERKATFVLDELGLLANVLVDGEDDS